MTNEDTNNKLWKGGALFLWVTLKYFPLIGHFSGLESKSRAEPVPHRCDRVETGRRQETQSGALGSVGLPSCSAGLPWVRRSANEAAHRSEYVCVFLRVRVYVMETSGLLQALKATSWYLARRGNEKGSKLLSTHSGWMSEHLCREMVSVCQQWKREKQ